MVKPTNVNVTKCFQVLAIGLPWLPPTGCQGLLAKQGARLASTLVFFSAGTSAAQHQVELVDDLGPVGIFLNFFA